MDDFHLYYLNENTTICLESAYPGKYRILEIPTKKYLVTANDNIDWVEKPSDPFMFRDVFDPFSLVKPILDDNCPHKIKLYPVSKQGYILFLHNNVWSLKKERYVSEDEAWVIVQKPPSTPIQEAPKPNSDHIPSTQIIEDNPLENIQLDWLGVISSLPEKTLSECIPDYLLNQVLQPDVAFAQIEPSLYFLYWVSYYYTDLPENCLFIGSSQFKVDEWPIHHQVESGSSILDRQVRVRDGQVFDREHNLKDDLITTTSCHFSVFVRQLLKLSDNYLPYSSNHCYLIPKNSLQRFPHSYYQSLWWRISKNPKLYPAHYLNGFWGYLTTS